MRLFIHILLQANYIPKEFEGIKVERGQYVTSVSTLSRELRLSARQVRTSLVNLKLTNEITIKTTNKYTLLTVVNYRRYQDNPNQNDKQDDKQDDKQTTNKRQTNDKQTTTTNIIDEYNELDEPNKPLKSSDNSNPPTGQKLSAQKQKDLILKDQFNQARLKFPGTKRGLDVEFDYLKKTHKKTWREIIPELLPAINNRIEVAQMKGYNQEFFAEWAHFKTYIFNSKWTESFGEVKSYFTGR